MLFLLSVLTQSSETASRNRLRSVNDSTTESTPQLQSLQNPFTDTQQPISSASNSPPESNPSEASYVAELVTLTTKHVSGSTENSKLTSSPFTSKQTSSAIPNSQKTSSASTWNTVSASSLKYTSALSPKTPSLFVSALKQTSSSSPETRTQAASTLKYVSAESPETPSTTRILTTASISATTSAVKIPPVNCSFPFTLGGVLNYKCVASNYSLDVGCFVDNRVWFGCSPPLGEQQQLSLFF